MCNTRKQNKGLLNIIHNNTGSSAMALLSVIFGPAHCKKRLFCCIKFNFVNRSCQDTFQSTKNPYLSDDRDFKTISVLNPVFKV